MRIHASLVLGLATTLLLGGCLQRLSDPYESCSVSADCRRGTDRCLSVVVPGVGSGNICSSQCSSRADCPSDWMGVAGDCRSFGGGANCFQACAGSSDCNPGFSCSDPDGLGRICLPSGGGTVLRASYESCTFSSDCANSSDQCLDVVIPGMSSGSLCSTPCSSSAQCPRDWMGAQGDCRVLGSGGANCYQACNDPSDCNGGFRCVDPDGSGFRLCLP